MAKQPSINQQVTLLAFCFIFVGIAISYLWVIPNLKLKKQALADDQAKEASLQSNITTLQGASQQLQQMQATLQSKGVDMNHLADVMPPTEDVPGLYIQLEALMKSTANVTASYQVSNPVADPAGGAKIPVTVTATGSYSDLKAFVVNMENNIRPVSFTSLSYTQVVDKDSTAPSNQYSLNALGYVRAQGLSSAYKSSTTTTTSTPQP